MDMSTALGRSTEQASEPGTVALGGPCPFSLCRSLMIIEKLKYPAITISLLLRSRS